MSKRPEVGDVWYRYYTKTFDAGVAILCDRYRVIKVCPSSVWLSCIRSTAPDGSDLRWDDEKFLVGINCRSSKAKPTREEAWRSYKVRTRKRVSHLENQLSIAQAGLAHAEQHDHPTQGDGVWVKLPEPDRLPIAFKVGEPRAITERGTLCLLKPR